LAQDNDSLLARQVRKLLDNDPRFAAYDLTAEVRNGEVIVTGVVDTLSEKNDLVRSLKDLPGIRAVENAVSTSTDGQITDPEVLEEVMDEFAQTPGLDVSRVGAKVDGGVVRLVGRTENPDEIEAARRAAAKARGVREVISEVKVTEPGADVTLEQIFHSQVRNDQDGPAR
jgi:hyperosmotically inducible protein